MNHVRLIVTDLDGTLLRNDKSISDYSRSIFERCMTAGIIMAVATGRLEIEAKRFTDILKPDIIISNDGALARYNGEIIYKCEIEEDTVNRLLAELLKCRDVKDIVVSTEAVCYWNSTHIEESIDRHEAVFNDYSAPLNMKAIKIVAEIQNKDTALSIIEKFPECSIIPLWGINRYSYLKKGTTKMNSIKAVANILGIDLTEIAAFGDDFNDKEMIKQCGYGVAVSNAIEQIQKSAKYVTKSNEEDGVARFIEENFLE